MKKKEIETLTIEEYSKEFKNNFLLAKAAIKNAHHDLEAGKEFSLVDVFKYIKK